MKAHRLRFEMTQTSGTIPRFVKQMQACEFPTSLSVFLFPNQSIEKRGFDDQNVGPLDVQQPRGEALEVGEACFMVLAQRVALSTQGLKQWTSQRRKAWRARSTEQAPKERRSGAELGRWRVQGWGLCVEIRRRASEGAFRALLDPAAELSNLR